MPHRTTLPANTSTNTGFWMRTLMRRMASRACAVGRSARPGMTATEKEKNRPAIRLEAAAAISVIVPMALTVICVSRTLNDSSSLSLARSSRMSSMTDALGEALHLMRMSGTFYCRTELTEPWGLTMPDMADRLWFHVLTSGRCDIQVDGRVTSLEPGDVLLVPGGQGHRLFSGDAETPLVTTLPHTFETDSYAILRHGAGGAVTHLVCGAVQFDHPAAKHLIKVLPHVLYVRQADDMRATIDLMAAEARTLRPGGEAVITRLADVLVIQTIRSWLTNDPAARTGWLGALQDQQIGQAL